MEEDVAQKGRTFMSGRHVGFMAEEVIKILKNVTDDQCVSEAPHDVKGGDVFILKLDSNTKSYDSKSDGLKWKSVLCSHIPKGRAETLTKRSFNIVNDKANPADVRKKDVYSPDFGKMREKLFFIHYTGANPSTTKVPTNTESDLTESTDVGQESNMKGKASEIRSTRGKAKSDGSIEDSAVIQKTDNVGEKQKSATDLEADRKNVEGVVQSMDEVNPVMDVFDKLIETMVSGKQNPDLELCLVVSNKKSGESALVGTEEAKKLAAQSPSLGLNREHLKRVSGKRKITEPDEQSGDEKKYKRQKKHEPVTEMTMYNGIVKKFPRPKRESVFSPSTVSVEEKQIHADFFSSNKKTKNADRYLKIRNHIIDLWKKEKPKYVNKLRVRRSLTDCGDVTAIGRVHAYLECKGVINYDAVEDGTHYQKKSKKQPAKNETDQISDCEDPEPSPKKKQKQDIPDSEEATPSTRQRTVSNHKEISDLEEATVSTRKRAVSYHKDLMNDKKAQESPITPRSSGRTRNIKTPNWADVLSGKVAFRDDADHADNVSPLKATKSSSPEKRNKTIVSQNIEKTKNKLKPPVKSLSMINDDNSCVVESVDNVVENSQLADCDLSLPEKSQDSTPDLHDDDAQADIGSSCTEISEERDRKHQESVNAKRDSDDAIGDTRNDQEIEESGKATMNESEADETSKGRGRPMKTRPESEERIINEKKEGPKRGRGRPRKYPDEEYVRDIPEEKSKYEVLEYAGSGNVYKMRAKGNRHMPFELKEVNFEEGEGSEEKEAKPVTNITIRIEPVGHSPEKTDLPEKTDSPRSSARVNRNKFVCEICNKGFSVEFVYNEHMKSHNKGVTAPAIVDATDNTEVDLDFQVEDGISYESDKEDIEDAITGKDVEIHSAEVKQSTGVHEVEPDQLYTQTLKPVCKICGTEFLTFANLRKHSLLHSNRMYECPYCAKLMKRKDYVNAHIRKVHKDVDLVKNPVDYSKYTHILPVEGEKEGENNDETEDVDQKQIKGENDKDSEQPETGIGKSVCPECNDIYDKQADLEQHMVLVHNKELKDAWYTCQACQRKFKSLVNYEVHKLTHREKAHDCQHCGKVFSSNSQLQVHRRHDHNVQYGVFMYFGFLMNDAKIACEICSEKFETMSDYIDHRPEHVTFEFLCRVCGNGFDSEDAFEIHKQSNCKPLNLHLACGLCDQKFSMYDTRRRHIVAAHPTRGDYYCHHCGKSFQSFSELTEHFTSHNKEKIFNCEICDKKFFEKRNLVDHRVLHKGVKDHKCSICDKYYISAKSLQRHIKMHLSANKYPCTLCDAKFGNKTDLERHFLLNHTGDICKENMDNMCSVCGKQFMKKTRLIQHMQVHMRGEDDETYTCPHCNNVYSPKDQPLWKHMKDAHPEELKQKLEKKELVCQVCGFRTVHKQRMTRHLETHNPDKRFKCSYCDKVFQTTSSLLTHIIVHRGRIRNSKYPSTHCSWPGCNKKFFRKMGMKSHLITHLFKLKNGKDVCDCEHCETSEVEEETKIAYLTEEGSMTVMMDGNTVLLRSGQLHNNVGQNSDTVNVVINSDGVIQGYESMNVLQEAIAKIEDLEKQGKKEATDGSYLVMSLADDRYAEMVEQDKSDDVTEDAEMHEENSNDEHVDHINEAVNQQNTVGVQAELEDGVQMLNNCRVAEDNSIVVGKTIIRENKMVRGLVNNAEMNTIASQYENRNRDTSAIQHDTEVCEQLDGNSGTDNVESSAVENYSNVIMGDNVAGVNDESGSMEVDNNVISELSYNGGDDGVEIHAELDGYECCYCELMFPTKCLVLSHLEEDHRDHQFPACQVCDKYFISNKHLSDHMVIHTKDRKYSCETCGKAFRTKQCLKQHSYIHAEVKPYICSYCGHGFTQKGFFEEHVRRHTGNRPFKCKVCNKGFYSRNLLKLHMYNHSGDNPYKCEFCPKTFRERYVLETHLRTHGDERPFKCNHCDKAFYAKPKLIRHLNTVHGIRKDYLSDYVATRIGSGFGYRAKKDKDKKDLLPVDEGRKTVVYIDYQGNIVKQELKNGEKFDMEEITKSKREHFVNNKTLHIQPKPEQILDSKVINSNMLTQETFEVLTRKDTSGEIMVNPIMSDDIETIDMEQNIGQNIIYQDVQAVNTENSIELDGENYTLVTQGDGLGHLQLITQALAEVQGGQMKQEGGEIQIVSEEVDTTDMQVDPASDVAVYTEEGGEGLEHVTENFSINIAEDGTVNPADFEKIEALRNLYNDQPIVIVLESQNNE